MSPDLAAAGRHLAGILRAGCDLIDIGLEQYYEDGRLEPEVRSALGDLANETAAWLAQWERGVARDQLSAQDAEAIAHIEASAAGLVQAHDFNIGANA